MTADRDDTGPAPSRLRRRLSAGFSMLWTILRRRRPKGGDRLPPLYRIENLIGLTVLVVGLALVFLDPEIMPLQRTISPEVARFFRSITDVGDSAFILVPTGLFCLVILLLDWSRHAACIRAGVNRAFFYSGYIFFSVAASGLLVIVLKILFGRARPRYFESLGAYHFNLFTTGAGNASFPSGHATTVAAFCAALIILFPRWRLVIIAFGLLGAFSRVFVGAHYPSDVLLGIFIGTVFSHRTALWLARRRLGFRISPKGRLMATGLGWPLVAARKLVQNPR